MQKQQRILWVGAVVAITVAGTLTYRTMSGSKTPAPSTTQEQTVFDKTGTIESKQSDSQTLTFKYEESGDQALTTTLTFDSASICASSTGSNACAAFNAPLTYAYGGKKVHVTGIPKRSEVLVSRIEIVADEDAPNRATISTKINQSINALSVTIKPLAVTEDSRCATNVQCIWAGTVKVRALLSYGSTEKEVVFERGMAVSTDDAFITLTAVAPNKVTEGAIPPADYSFTFEITAR